MLTIALLFHDHLLSSMGTLTCLVLFVWGAIGKKMFFPTLVSIGLVLVLLTGIMLRYVRQAQDEEQVVLAVEQERLVEIHPGYNGAVFITHAEGQKAHHFGGINIPEPYRAGYVELTFQQVENVSSYLVSCGQKIPDTIRVSEPFRYDNFGFPAVNFAGQ
jgi:hypothetical protein